MQKKIIALAVVAAAASAPAFADTTLYGLVDMAVANVSADSQRSDFLAVSGGLSTSRFGIKSAEDLGGGLKAVVNLEYKVDAGTSTLSGGTNNGVTARQQLLGLAGDFGTVAAGYLQTTAWDFQNSYDPTSGSTVSPLGNVTKAGDFLIGSVAAAARAQRALAYISPNMSGVTVAVNYSTNLGDGLGNLTLPSGQANGLKTTATLVSANYAGGPIAAGFVYAGTSNDSTPQAAIASEWALGGSYDFGVAKLFATYQSNSPSHVANTTSSKAESVSAVAPVGPGALVLSYAKDNMATNSTSASGETVGYLYDLSKTATVYAAYSKMSQDNGTHAYSVFNDGVAGSAAAGWTAGGGSSSMIALGLRKKF